jgi:uncharacterized SAM-binding protein YcdF (DUF218 family)
MIHAFYSLSAAVALVSNVFLLSLLVNPSSNPPIADAALWPKPAYTCHGHRTVQVSNKFRFDLPEDSPPRLVESAARFRNRIFSSEFKSPVPMNAEDAELEDRSQVGILKLKALIVDVEDKTGQTALEYGIDGEDIVRSPRARTTRGTAAWSSRVVLQLTTIFSLLL